MNEKLVNIIKIVKMEKVECGVPTNSEFDKFVNNLNKLLSLCNSLPNKRWTFVKI